MNEFVPEDAEAKVKYVAFLKRGYNELQAIDVAKENIKLIAEDVKETLDIKPADFKKFLGVYYKENLHELREELDALEEGIDSIKTVKAE